MNNDNGTNTIKAAARRPQTPYDFSLLKTIRYEDAAAGDLPKNKEPPSSPSSSPRSPTSRLPSSPTRASAERQQQQQSKAHLQLFPNPQSPGDQHKRDSAVAPSDTLTGRLASCKASSDHRSSGTSAPEAQFIAPPLPTIQVESETPPPSRRSKSPFARKRKTRYPQSDQAEDIRGVRHVQSFHGISMDIPTGELEDLTTPGNLQFSHRGSMLLGGQKMDELIAAEGERMKEEEASSSLPPQESREQVPPRTPPQTLREQVPGSTPQGLRSGRRTPSIHALKAAMQGGRVLSAEEISFSLRVRSMYEHGDENAADWTTPPTSPDRPISSMADEQYGDRDPQSSEPDHGMLCVNKTRGTLLGAQSRTFSPTSVRTNYTVKDSNELAGGMEDWVDVEGRDVDRYGFINPSRVMSRDSSNEDGYSPIRPGVQRVSTSLQLLANSPRRKRAIRKIPSTRSTRSTLQKAGRDAQSLRTKGSLYSVRSTSSSVFDTMPFRSRNRRLLDEASDMLTLPPGLADIEEQEDGGRTANLLKRREWVREEKWRKMARLVPSTKKGGGMSFDFDTRDSQLIARTWKGIPDRWRATAWHSFLLTSAKRRHGANKFETDEHLIQCFNRYQEESCADDVQIDVDVPRTINMHIMFRRRYRGGQRLLFRVLHAISLHFPTTGYVQGMASLAATLLCYYSEEAAFVMLARLWVLRGLATLYSPGFDGLMSALSEFESKWLAAGDSRAVAAKLKDLGIDGTAYGTRWYLTLFNMSVPFPAQLRIWDVFMLLGDSATTTATTANPLTMAPATTATAGGRAVSTNNNITEKTTTENGSANIAKTNTPPFFGGAELDVLHATSAALIDATKEVLLDSDFENAMKVLTSWIPVKDEDLLMRVAKAEYKAKKKRGL